MGIHRSALKRERQAIVRRERNRSVLSMLKTLLKKVHSAIEEKKVETAQHALLEVTSALDKAASKGFIHRNTAARRASRLTLKVNSILGGGESSGTGSGPTKQKGA